MFYECVKQTLIYYGYSSRQGPMHKVYPGSLKQYWTFRLSEGSGVSTEKIHHHVLQFLDGTRNLWRQDQRWI